MTEILLEPLICRKYPRNIQNTLNLYFGNFRCFRCIFVILHVQGCFGHNLGFKGFFQSFFLGFGVILAIFWVLGIFWRFQSFGGYYAHFRDFGGILVIWWVLGGFFWGGYFGHFLGFWGIFVIFRFQGYFGHFQVLGVFW